MKKLIDFGQDDHPEDAEEKVQSAWAVAVMDDCEDCADLRVELTLEEVGPPGYGQIAHLSPGSARRLQAALTRALQELGETA